MEKKGIKEYKKTTYSKPKEIKSLDFFPMKEYKLDKVREKGKIYWWKLFGKIPIFPYKAKNDRYNDDFCEFIFYKPTFDELVKRYFHGDRKYYVDCAEKKIYKLPCVTIHYEPFGYNESIFKTNEEAYEFCDKLAKKHKLEKNIH